MSLGRTHDLARRRRESDTNVTPPSDASETFPHTDTPLSRATQKADYLGGGVL